VRINSVCRIAALLFLISPPLWSARIETVAAGAEAKPTTSSESFWTMVGSLATAGAAVVALLAFLGEMYTTRRQRERREAQTLRQNLQRVVDANHTLSALLREGDPLIYGAAVIGDTFGARLGPLPTSADFWRELKDHHGACLLAAVKGWDSSPVTERLNHLIDRQGEAALSLTGKLALVAEATTILSGITHDAYSPIVFSNVFEALSHPALPFLDRNKHEQDVHALVRHLSHELMSNTSAYFATRYLTAVERIAQFVKASSNALMNLDDKALLRASQSDEQAFHTGTHMGNMKNLLDQLQESIGNDSYTRLSVLLAEIETGVSKEAAAERLDKLRLRQSQQSPAGA
jgi:hypothetical protein